MAYDSIYSIASLGMSFEKLRIDTVANNIANQYTLQYADNPPFQAMQVVVDAKPFAEILSQHSAHLEPQNIPPNKVYDPGNPLADNKGYLNYPGLDMVKEMSTLLQASRAYEADIKVINTAHNLYIQALSIGEDR